MSALAASPATGASRAVTGLGITVQGVRLGLDGPRRNQWRQVIKLTCPYIRANPRGYDSDLVQLCWLVGRAH